MKYWLRRVIFEDIWERQTDELVSLCGRAQIDGVLLMEQSHMALMAPYPVDVCRKDGTSAASDSFLGEGQDRHGLGSKHERMAGIYRKMSGQLKEAGIHFGINIASLVGHSDMEVPDDYRMDFQRFVGDDGKEAAACYCILDKRWQEYASRVCALYAGTGPECLFLDDDFRSLNHGRQLGCFCPIHVEKTAAKLGRPVTAEQIMDALREPGLPDGLAIRTAWMEANYEGQKEAAAAIEKEVHRSFPDVCLGLMSSDELRHSLQGRPIEDLLHTLAGPGRKMMYRPTGAIYGDALHKAVFEGHQRMSLTMGEIEHPVHVVSELELFPHTRFTCSRRFSEIMMKTQILAGADDITLNLYDYLGNPVEREPIWEEMLRDNKGFLRRLARLRHGKHLKGFGLPYRMTESRYRTMKKGEISSLYPDRNLDLLLPSMGIPVQFTEGDANAVIGEAMWCYTEEELERFLSKGFLTDARGAEVLIQRGLGQYLGCRPVPAGEEIPAMERMDGPECCGQFLGDILPTRWNLFLPQDRWLLIPQEDAISLTTLLDLEKCPLGAGAVLYHNSLGGVCAVLAVPPRQDTWGYRAKAHLIKEIIHRLSDGVLPVTIPDCPNVGPIYYEDEQSGEGLLAVLNGSLDAYNYHMELNGIGICERADMAPSDRLQKAVNAKRTDPDSGRIVCKGHLDGIAITFYETRRL